MYITITGSMHYLGMQSYKIGQELTLIKDLDDCYDDESIKVLTDTGTTCGHVANSVHSVARGSHSAGYIYNLIKDNQKCIISFIIDDYVIAKII